jgi:hypothetical protein
MGNAMHRSKVKYAAAIRATSDAINEVVLPITTDPCDPVDWSEDWGGPWWRYDDPEVNSDRLSPPNVSAVGSLAYV